MTILNIVQYPDLFLREKAKPVENIDETILKLIEDMGETMYEAPGVGLAAPQVRSDKRIIVYNPDAGCEEDHFDGENAGKKEFQALINPEIIAASGSIISEKEACLSVPDFSANVKRYEFVTVKALTPEGKKIQFDKDGIQAVIMQHEIDHLDGVLYIDRISALKRNMYKKKMNKKR